MTEKRNEYLLGIEKDLNEILSRALKLDDKEWLIALKEDLEDFGTKNLSAGDISLRNLLLETIREQMTEWEILFADHGNRD
jgi:hypothetical protein